MKISFVKAHNNNNNNKSSTYVNIPFTYTCWRLFLFLMRLFEHSSPCVTVHISSHYINGGRLGYRLRKWWRDKISMPISYNLLSPLIKCCKKKEKISSQWAPYYHPKLLPISLLCLVSMASLFHELLNPM